MPLTAVVNARLRPADVPPPPGPEPTEFHRALPGYRPTLLRELPTIAAELGLASVHVKDESDRLGLPAFKILGASWAVERTLRERPGTELLVAASAGNHGRAVARAAALRGLRCRIHLPAGATEARAAPIRAEGAEVIRTAGGYEAAVAAAEADGSAPRAAVVADVAYEPGARTPGWVVDGYATLFREAAAQAPAPFGLILVPAGVGSLAAAAVAFAAHEQDPPAAVVAVEPVTAACVAASLAAGERVEVPTPGTAMAGLDCAVPSAGAWPALRAGLLGAVAVADDAIAPAMAELAALGAVLGECGAAPLVALRALARDPGCADLAGRVPLGPATRVLLIGTEGLTSEVAR